MRSVSFHTILQGGDRRSIGNSNSVVAEILRDPNRISELVQCLWSDDPIVRMRAADALEKASATRSDLLHPFKAQLLGLADETTQAEIRWHLALMLPRLDLSLAEKECALSALRRYLDDRSSIVKTCTLQALAELARGDTNLQNEVIDLLESAGRGGTPAMKARSRKLLKELQK
jgi:hypothetical protein